MPFLSDLIVKSVRGTEERVLNRALVYEARNKELIVVPRGFKTDYASIPGFLRGWIDQDSGQIRDAAVLHDYLYSIGKELGYSRYDADYYFYEAMRSLGMGRIKAWTAWVAVRSFGRSHYIG